VDSGRQQELIDSAGERVASKAPLDGISAGKDGDFSWDFTVSPCAKPIQNGDFSWDFSDLIHPKWCFFGFDPSTIETWDLCGIFMGFLKLICEFRLSKRRFPGSVISNDGEYVWKFLWKNYPSAL
jgi:hypothetical protein